MSSFVNELQIFGAPAFPIYYPLALSTEGTALSGLDTVDFSIVADVGPGDSLKPVFSGRAAKRPGDAYPTVVPNDILAGYVRNVSGLDGVLQNKTDFPDYYGVSIELVRREYWWDSVEIRNGGAIKAGGVIPSVAVKFKVVWSDPAGVIADAEEAFTIFADWAYNGIPHYGSNSISSGWMKAFLNDPISDVIDKRQFITVTTIGATYVRGLNIQRYSQGTNQSYEAWRLHGERADVEAALGGIPLTFWMLASMIKEAPDGYWDKNKPHGFVFEASNEAGNFGYLPIRDFNNPYHQEFFHIEDTCARYVLYYQNALGGIDWLVLRGKCTVEDSITRSEIKRKPFVAEIIPLYPQLSRGRDVLTVTATKSLNAHTHWLTDAEAAKMHNLLESPLVWIHDLDAPYNANYVSGTRVYPAVITNTSCEYKTYKQQGNHLVQYEIQLDFAAEIQRA